MTINFYRNDANEQKTHYKKTTKSKLGIYLNKSRQLEQIKLLVEQGKAKTRPPRALPLTLSPQCIV